MQVSIQVDTSKFEKFSDYMMKFPDDLLEVGGEAVYNYLVEFHANTDWREGRWFPGSRSGEFQRDVVEGWQPPERSGNTITIDNTFGLLKWKTTGGTITPQRATHLTIPLISEARGRSVAEFSSSGNRLFRAGEALCRKVGKKIEAVYALSHGVRQSPYRKAMPTQHQLEEVIERAARQMVRRIR